MKPVSEHTSGVAEHGAGRSGSMATGKSVAGKKSWWRKIAGYQNRHLWFWSFAGPFFLGLLCFVYVPIVWSATLSLFEAKNTVWPTKFVGLDNYISLLSNKAFTDSMVTFILFSVIIVPLTYVCSLGLALLLHRIKFMQAFFRSVFFIPTAVSYVVASMVWRLSLFSGTKAGVANSALRLFGMDQINWLGGENHWYWLVIVSLRLWLQVGFYMILFIAGINRIDPATYEAASIDGASGWRVTRHITIPQLRATSAMVLMLLLINAFQAFDEFWNTLASTDAYPNFARPPLVYLYLISIGGQQQNLGLGSAGTMILAFVIAVFGILQSAVVNRGQGKEVK